MPTGWVVTPSTNGYAAGAFDGGPAQLPVPGATALLRHAPGGGEIEDPWLRRMIGKSRRSRWQWQLRAG